MTGSARAVLFDVDGTLLDVLVNLRRVWGFWARRHDLDGDEVYAVALRTRPTETFAQVAPDRDPDACLAVLHELEDQDARSGRYGAFAGAGALLHALPPDAWGVVTSNYAHRVRTRFERTSLPMPEVLVDASAVSRGKPHPEGYLAAAAALGRLPEQCLVLEDGLTGVQAARAAGMTVCAVNVPSDSPPAKQADLHFATLAEAVDDVLAWVTTPP